MIASNVELFSEVYQDLFDNMKRINKSLENISNALKSRVEQYFTYITQLKAKNNYKINSIKEYLPKNLYDELVFFQAKPFLTKLPIFKDINCFLLKEIATVLNQSLFLPGDYIVYKGDLGDEMYFIIEGIVNVLSPNETQTVVQLTKGSYFGEIALFNKNSTRICSVVAETFCKIFILNKKNLEAINKRWPDFQEKMKKEGDRRIEEYQQKNEEINESYMEYSMSRNSPKPSLKSSNFKFQNPIKLNESIDSINENSIQSQVNQIPSNQYKKSLIENKNKCSCNFNNEIRISKKPLTMIHKSEISKMKFLVSDQMEDNNTLDFNEFVEIDEMDNINDPRGIPKQSRRFKCKNNKERRFSRITLGEELALSKFSGLRLQWGIAHE